MEAGGVRRRTMQQEMDTDARILRNQGIGDAARPRELTHATWATDRNEQHSRRGSTHAVYYAHNRSVRVRPYRRIPAELQSPLRSGTAIMLPLGSTKWRPLANDPNQQQSQLRT